MSRVRNLTDLLEPTGDVKLDHLDNTVSVTVTDNLISTSAIEALSANQGTVLKTLVDDLESARALAKSLNVVHILMPINYKSQKLV